MVLEETLMRECSNLSAEEFKLAYELAIASKLDCDPTHYQSFSSMYMLSVITAYLEYKRKENVLILAKENQQKQNLLKIDMPLDSQLTVEECYNQIKGYIESKEDINLRIIVPRTWNGAYIHAEKEGYIKLNANQKKAYERETIKTLTEKMFEAKATGLGIEYTRTRGILYTEKEVGEEGRKIKPLLIAEMRKSLVTEYLTKQLNNEPK